MTVLRIPMTTSLSIWMIRQDGAPTIASMPNEHTATHADSPRPVQ
jgi:hypothetical protein